MRGYHIVLMTGFWTLCFLIGCCEDVGNNPEGETGISFRFDWVGTPREVPIPKGTTLLFYTGKEALEEIESGLDGYAAQKAADVYDVVVYNRDLTDAEVMDKNCSDSISFRALRSADGSLVEPSWALGAVEKGLTVKKGTTLHLDVKMKSYTHRIVLYDKGVSDQSVVSYEGRLEGLSAGIRLKDGSLTQEIGSMPVHFEYTDSGWVSSFLSFGIHPDYPCRLTRTVTFKDGRTGTTIVDITKQASNSIPTEAGETQVIRLDMPLVTELPICATSVAISGDYLLLGTEKGAFVSEYRAGVWLTPIAVVDKESELDKTPIQSVVLSGTNGVIADIQGRCWWIGKSSSGWTVRRIPVPASEGPILEIKEFGAAVAINENYVAISAPGSVLGMSDEAGNYNQFDKAGVVFVYPVNLLAQGKTDCRRLLPAPMVAMTNYGYSLSFGKKDRLAVGVSKDIRSYATDLVSISSNDMEKVPYASSPALGGSLVLTDGDILLTQMTRGTLMYTYIGKTLTPFPCDLPAIDSPQAWSLDGKVLILKGDLYRLTEKGWVFDSSLSDYLPIPGNRPTGWGRCSSLQGDRAVVSSEDKTYVLSQLFP